jgi:hypothetical protein
MKSAIALGLILWTLSFAWGDPPSRVKAEDDIREATFLYQFQHLTTQQVANAKFHCLVYGDKEAGPSDQFLKRFAGHQPPIKNAALVYGSGDGYFTKGSHDRVLLFRVTHIKWVTDSEVEVGGGCLDGSSTDSPHIYSLRKEKDKWVVTKDVKRQDS